MENQDIKINLMRCLSYTLKRVFVTVQITVYLRNDYTSFLVICCALVEIHGDHNSLKLAMISNVRLASMKVGNETVDPVEV